MVERAQRTGASVRSDSCPLQRADRYLVHGSTVSVAVVRCRAIQASGCKHLLLCSILIMSVLYFSVEITFAAVAVSNKACAQFES